MEASKVTFFAATKEKINNPGLDNRKRRELKIQLVKEFIRSRPAGSRFRMTDLMAAAGYNYKDANQYSSGFSFIKNLAKNGIIKIEDTPKYSKQVIIVQDETVKTIQPQVETAVTETNENTAKDIAPEDIAKDVAEQEDERYKNYGQSPPRLVIGIALIRQIEELAREFAWRNDSNDLREFIRSLK